MYNLLYFCLLLQ